MNLSIAIIGLLTVAAFVLPLVLLERHRKAKQKKFLYILTEMAQRQGGEISEFEYFNNTGIGLDKRLHIVYFSRNTKAGQPDQVIDLKSVYRCRVVNTSNSVSRKESSVTVIEKIHLVFAFKDKTKPETLLEFYNNDHDSLTISGEMQIAEKWARLINEQIVKVTK